jgi:hypothetical protein
MWYYVRVYMYSIYGRGSLYEAAVRCGGKIFFRYGHVSMMEVRC